MRSKRGFIIEAKEVLDVQMPFQHCSRKGKEANPSRREEFMGEEKAWVRSHKAVGRSSYVSRL